MPLNKSEARRVLARRLHENWLSKHEALIDDSATEQDDSLTNLSWLCRLTAHPTPGDCDPEFTNEIQTLAVNGYMKHESVETNYVDGGFVREEILYSKPPYSYTTLISMAIKDSSDGKLSLAEIYKYISVNFPYYSNAPLSWQNSIRHSLSLNKCFMKVPRRRNQTGTGKGGLWMIDPNYAHLVSENKRNYVNDCYRRTISISECVSNVPTKRSLDENNNIEAKKMKQRRVNSLSDTIIKKGLASTLTQPRGAWDEAEHAVMGLQGESVPSPTSILDDIPILEVSTSYSRNISSYKQSNPANNCTLQDKYWQAETPSSIEVDGVKINTSSIMMGDADFSAISNHNKQIPARVSVSRVPSSFIDDEFSACSPVTDFSGYSTPSTELEIPHFETYLSKTDGSQSVSLNTNSLPNVEQNFDMNQFWDRELDLSINNSDRPTLQTLASTGSSDYDTESQFSESKSYIDDAIDNYDLNINTLFGM